MNSIEQDKKTKESSLDSFASSVDSELGGYTSEEDTDPVPPKEEEEDEE